MVVAVPALLWLAPARAQLSQEMLASAMGCERARHPTTRIDGWTEVIGSGQLNGHPDILSRVLDNRAIAFRELGRSAGTALQQFLAQHGYHSGPIDGIVGPATLQALQVYLGTGCGA